MALQLPDVGGPSGAADLRRVAAQAVAAGGYLTPAIRQALAASGTFGQNTIPDPVKKVARAADRVTGVSQLAQGALWSVSHPIDRLMGRGMAAQSEMAVPWVAGKPWFHGSSRAFNIFDLSKADREALYGPGHYITDNPRIASTYAGSGPQMGSVHGMFLTDAQRMTAEQDVRNLGFHPVVEMDKHGGGRVRIGEPLPSAAPVAPNVTMYSFKPNRVFDVEKAISKNDINRMRRGLNVAARKVENAQPNSSVAIAQSNAGAKLISKDWRGARTLDDLYALLAEDFGKEFANVVIRRAGYDAIRYPGGKALGGEAHNAMVVLNPKTLVRGGRPKP